MMKKILVIDDDAMNRDILQAFLSNRYEVVLANNGIKGLQLAKEVLPHLILLDVRMPDMSGFDVCTALKAYEDTRNIPIMFITGYDSPDDIQRGKDAGAQEFLSRPFDGDALMRLVARLIQAEDDSV